ncbi:GNAT family N-acetyltransferase [Phaeobacter sp. C3_T13_0]|uniref:GNAT family N-acetyltransferase n=1 Tax=Phaeobacter cretensis TaxID=3342641 RepID=UPI0039BC2BB8
MNIRHFRSEDAAALAQIFHAAVHGVGARDYSAAQLAAWSPEPAPSDHWHRRATDGREVFVAVDANDQAWGFIELEQDGHIDCFYCHPDVAGIGVGLALYQQLETCAWDLGLTLLFVEASEAAKRFFIRQSFIDEGRRDFERRGVPMHNYRMTKTLI